MRNVKGRMTDQEPVLQGEAYEYSVMPSIRLSSKRQVLTLFRKQIGRRQVRQKDDLVLYPYPEFPLSWKVSCIHESLLQRHYHIRPYAVSNETPYKPFPP
jgi:hypothetical protein